MNKPKHCNAGMKLIPQPAEKCSSYVALHKLQRHVSDPGSCSFKFTIDLNNHSSFANHNQLITIINVKKVLILFPCQLTILSSQ